MPPVLYSLVLIQYDGLLCVGIQTLKLRFQRLQALVSGRHRAVSQEQGGIVAWVGFPEWVRGPARIVDGEVALDRSRAERYALHNVHGAIFELAVVRIHQDIRAFVRRYGLLWHGPDSLDTGQHGETVSDWKTAAREAALVVLLYLRLREAEETGSADPVRDLNITWSGAPEATNEREYLRLHSMGLARLINQRMGAWRSKLTPGFQFEEEAGPGKFVFTHQAPNLLAAAYTDFATTIVSQRAELKECPGCGRVFHPESGKQKYCTKSCASTSRWRRWKEQQSS
jgi:hypothetical protein